MTAPSMLQRFARDREAVLGVGRPRWLIRQAVNLIGNRELVHQLVDEESDAAGLYTITLTSGAA